jgi:hypothetical protein
MYNNGTFLPDEPFIYTWDGTDTTLSNGLSWDLASGTLDFIEQNLRSSRVVSAAVAVNTTAAVTATSGILYAASLPRGFFPNGDPLKVVGAGTQNFRFTDIDTWPGSIAVPLNKGEGATSLYFPVDEMCRVYSEQLTNDTENIGPGYEPSEVDESLRPGFMVFYVTGAEPGTTMFFDIVLNLEGLPATNSVLLSMASPLMHDEYAIDHADDVLNRCSSSFQGTSMASHGEGPLGGRLVVDESSHTKLYLHTSPSIVPTSTFKHVTGKVHVAGVKDLGKKLAKFATGAAPYVRLLDKVLASIL